MFWSFLSETVKDYGTMSCSSQV